MTNIEYAKEFCKSLLEVIEFNPKGTHFCMLSQQSGYALNSVEMENLAECFLKLLEENKHLEIFTCYKCELKDKCEYVWDWYNTHGDCLAEK